MWWTSARSTVRPLPQSKTPMVGLRELDRVDRDQPSAVVGPMTDRMAEIRLAENLPGGRVRDQPLIGGDVDAVDLVVGDETFKPLHLWTKLLENAAGLLRDSLELLRGQFTGAGNPRSMTYLGMVGSCG